MTCRILFVDHDSTRTGSTVSMEYLLRAFATRGCEVHILTPKRGNEARVLQEMGVLVHSSRRWKINSLGLDIHFTNTLPVFSIRGIYLLLVNLAKFVLGMEIVWREIRSIRPDLVYVNEQVLLQASVAARWCGVPCVMHARSLLAAGRWGIRRGMVVRLATRCNRFIFAISSLEAQQYARRGSIPANVTVVGEFVPPTGASLQPTERTTDVRGDRGSRRAVSMLGGILGIKGTLTFLRAAELIASEQEDVLFVIAGPAYDSGREAEHYRACMTILKRLEGRGQGKYVGFIDDVGPLILGSAVLVSPSLETHFSRPIVEAWAAGKPVIAARTPHTETLVSDGVNGVLVPPGDEHALAVAMKRLLTDPALRIRLGEEGRKRAEAEFDAEANCGRIVSLCLGLIGPPAQAPFQGEAMDSRP